MQESSAYNYNNEGGDPVVGFLDEIENPISGQVLSPTASQTVEIPRPQNDETNYLIFERHFDQP